ncbi:hypothetical protein CXF86_21755 [Shewanella sp. GutCb]|uniref:winged helix-turn-helix domain-containing protein n=1 Tax=Shewanella sp. GutCb TaxID=2058315 RepID=UPI000C7C4F34|nr:winged helix-turn-helix domain-containing protein [Shewanella sp. GutCb]PKG72564.1 hypothetical protein CXF86_21755 [Shewanella sp. GutCb]
MVKQSYRIDNWFFIPHENKLILDEQEILIDNRLSNLLLFLCHHPKTTLSRDEIINHVWKGSILTDQVITQAIFELRKILKTNNLHLQGYIITVPKRGYKLDIDVETISAPFKPLLALQETASGTTTGSVASDAVATALPLQAASIEAETNDAIATQMKLGKDKKFEFRLSTIVASVGGVIGLTAALVFYLSPSMVKPVPTQTSQYIALEPRFIQASIDNQLVNANLQNGIIFKVIEYLKYNVNYRVSFNAQDEAMAAKVVSFIVTNENGIDYVNVEYLNKISNYQHLDRKYPISENHLKHSIKVMLDDILDAFNIDIANADIDQVLAAMPNDPQALAYSLEAIGALHSSKNQFDSVLILQKALDIEPSNHYLISMSYIYQMTIAYLDKSNLALDEIKALNNEFELVIADLIAEPASFKVYEALALHALSKDLPIEAVQYLNKIPHTHNTIMTFILRAKLSESFGNPASAEEFYYQALHESGTPRVLDFAESLLFYSDLSKMKSKINSTLTTDLTD